jgi:hypothetical protein
VRDVEIVKMDDVELYVSNDDVLEEASAALLKKSKLLHYQREFTSE